MCSVRLCIMKISHAESQIGLKDVTPPPSEPKVLCSCCSESGLSEDIFSCEVCGVAVHPGKYLVRFGGMPPDGIL